MTHEWWQSDQVRPGLEKALKCSPRRALEILSGILPGSRGMTDLLVKGIPENRRSVVYESRACKRLEGVSSGLHNALRVFREAPGNRSAAGVLRILGGLLDGIEGIVEEDRQQSKAAREALEEVLLEAILAEPSCNLAVYGTLAPGESNHGVLEGINGVWREGFVRGALLESGWGAELGFPALRWDPSRAGVPIKLLVSKDLPSHWEKLDEFEGDEYRRILVPVEEPGVTIAVANIYVINDESSR